MDVKDEIVQIKEVLKKHPRGINVIDIAREVDMNRQTVTKYLDMLVVSGNVDVKTFGPSKVYYLSQRLPISSMLSLSSDFILLLDKNLNVVDVNEPFLDFTNTKREDILGKDINAIRFPLQFDPPITPYITDALDGKECRFEANYKKRGNDLCYGIKFIPLVFDDGQPGASIMFEDITERKKAELALLDAKGHLESVVRERTAELQQINDRLRDEVAERIEAEGRVNMERQRLNDVLETLPAYLILLTPDYHVPVANRFFRERFGDSGGKRCYEYLFGRTEPCENCETYKVLKTGAPHHWEWTGPDGRNYDIYDFPFKDVDGSPLIMEMGIDITERKQAEIELEKHKKHLEELIHERTRKLEEVNARLQVDIAERKKAEAALLENESRLQQTETILLRSQEAGKVGSWHLDLKKNELWWSPETYRMFGFAPDKKLTYENFLSIVHPEDRDAVNQAWTKALVGAPYNIEHRIVIDGQVKWMHEKAILEFDQDGSPIFGIGTVADITERKQVEEKLRKSGYQMARALQIARMGSWEVDVRTNRVTGSLELFDLWDLDPESYTMETFIGKIHPEDRQRNNDSINAAINEHKTYDEEFRILTSRGERVMRSTGKTFYDDAGRPLTFFGIVQDITERKRVEIDLREKQEELAVQAEELESQVEELRSKNEELEIQVTERMRAETALGENEKKLNVLFNLLPVGVSILARDRNVLETNAALGKILGIGPGGFSHRAYEGRKYYRTDGTEMPASEFPSHVALREDRDIENVEIRIVKEDGATVWTNVSAVRMPFKDWALALTTSDITRLKAVEEHQESLIRQLKESNEQLSAIRSVAESAMSTLDLNPLLASILNSIMRVMRADAIVILLREEGQVRVRASIGIGQDLLSKFSVPIGAGFAGKIAGSGQPHYIEDVEADGTVASSIIKETGIRSILGVPIRHQGEIIGVLHVDWFSIHPFSKTEQDFLQTLADSCSASITNAKIYEKTKAAK